MKETFSRNGLYSSTKSYFEIFLQFKLTFFKCHFSRMIQHIDLELRIKLE